MRSCRFSHGGLPVARFVLAAVVLLALADLAPARAQFVFGGPSYGYSYQYQYQRGFAVGFANGRVRVAGFAGGFASRSAFYSYGPTYFAPAFGPYLAPPGTFSTFLNPYFNPFAPPVIVAPVPFPVIVAGGGIADPAAVAGARPGVLPAGARPADWLVIAPKKEETIPPVNRVAAVPRPGVAAAVIPFDPFRAAAAVKVEPVEADKKKEAVRLIALGRDAFANGEFGRAAEHFARATASDDTNAEAHFLRAQAQFAAGKYADAVSALRAGLALDAKWPASAFDPTALHGGHPDRFDAQLAALKKALAGNPGVPELEFLLGYELWFTGAKADADKLFRAAEKRLADPAVLALFKLP
jgi:hypothetical protein